jgi:hypothetical protein
LNKFTDEEQEYLKDELKGLDEMLLKLQSDLKLIVDRTKRIKIVRKLLKSIVG